MCSRFWPRGTCPKLNAMPDLTRWTWSTPHGLLMSSGDRSQKVPPACYVTDQTWEVVVETGVRNGKWPISAPCCAALPNERCCACGAMPLGARTRITEENLPVITLLFDTLGRELHGDLHVGGVHFECAREATAQW